jgi:membrane associated rhomboid family serine protease
VSTPDPSAAVPQQVPVCYRHPDRETYIRCNRCERPICPDCMTSASVGFQCPECVAEGRATVREPRTVLGARTISRPYVTLTLIGLNVVLFGLEMLSKADPASGTNTIATQYGMWPIGVAFNDEYYRLFTSMFLHLNVMHIGFNMLVLWMLGPQLEQILGHVRYGALYLVAGIGGSVASFWFSDPRTIGIGASGAIFGLMGAYVVVGKALRSDITQVVGLIALNVVIGFVVGGIDWRAHLGGLVTGALVAAVFAFGPTRRNVALQVVSVIAVLALLGAAVVVRDQQLTAQFAGLVQVG